MGTREILFRGKRIDNGQWVYGFLWSNRVIATESVLGNLDEVVIDPATVGEYTGLKDTHGNRVFEGDILKLTREWSKGDIDVWFAIVEFGNQDGEYSHGWQLTQIAGMQGLTSDILLWLGDGVEKMGVSSQVLSENQIYEEFETVTQ